MKRAAVSSSGVMRLFVKLDTVGMTSNYGMKACGMIVRRISSTPNSYSFPGNNFHAIVDGSGSARKEFKCERPMVIMVGSD